MTVRNLVLISILYLQINLINCSVSLENMESFFQNSYDRNKDGNGSLLQFTEYFQFMEPQHNLTENNVKETFNFFDLSRDGQITLNQIIKISKIKIGLKGGHRQLHIGFTENQHEIQVMWVTNPGTYDQPVVHFGKYPSSLKMKSNATWTTYNVGKIGFHGRIYRAVMSNLEPLQRYYYRVGDEKTHTYSEIKMFKAPPSKNTALDEINIAVFADVGTFAPFGHFVMDLISVDNFKKAFDFVFLTGDIAYAGMNSQKVGEVEPIWDLFGELSQRISAYVPFMVGVGNHERYYGYESYFHRYRLPKQNQNSTNLYFSFDYAQVHIAYISSEHPYEPGSQQYKFLESDLKKARQNPNTKWIIVGAHRQFYCSNTRQSPEKRTPLSIALEDLLNEYKVDIMQTGHIHAYQRSWPVYKAKALKENQSEKYYVNPETPIYVDQGSGGALLNPGWSKQQPQWSAKRFSKYGYGRIKIVRGNHLKYEFVTLPFGQVADSWYIIKDPYASKEELEKIKEKLG